MAHDCLYIKPVVLANDYTGVVESSAQHILDKYTKDHLPDMEIIKAEILFEINENIASHNGINDHWKWKHINILPNSVIAMIIKKYYEVANISLAGTDSKDYTFLGMYQRKGEKKGLFLEVADDLNRIIYRLNSLVSDGDIKEIVRFLKDSSEIRQVNTDRDLVAVENGIFDYRTKVLIPFSPELVFTSKCRVAYNPLALKSPVYPLPDGTLWDFDSWLADLFDDDELTELAYQVIGMCLRPHCTWSKIVCAYSRVGMNGKGAICSLIEGILGEGTYVSIPFDCFSNDAYLEKLVTASAIITHENSTSDISKAKNLKAIATGDAITINRKYKQAIRLKYSGAILECINSLPRMNDTTDSWYRRLLIIPFYKTFQGREVKEIKSDFLQRKELKEYVVCKVLNMNYYELSYPQACKKMLKEYKEFNDPVRAFCKDVFPRFAWDFVPQSLIYEIYKSWYSMNNPGHSSSILGRNRFFISLRSAVEMDYPTAWKYEDKRYDGSQIATKAKGPEPLIAEYGVTSWMSNYKGADITKICTPDEFPKSAGLLRIKNK